ncbi:hypothetical protein RUND412_007908 [Rhizina undulata]
MQTRSSATRSTVSLSPEVTKSSTRNSPRDTCTALPRRAGSPENTVPPPRSTHTGTRRSRKERVIDLTDTSPVHHSITSPEHLESEGPSAKRRKTSTTAHTSEPAILIDDDEDEGVSNLLEKTRSDLIESQQKKEKPEDDRKKVAGFTCIICLEDEPTDLAVTPCGHMFCHYCLHGAIKASSAVNNNKTHGRCPVCRGKVSMKDIIPMEFKTLTKAQGKQKAPS